MRIISPSGRWLMCAAMLGLLAVAALPAAASATTVETDYPVAFAAAACTEPVAGVARFHLVTVIKDDGSMNETVYVRSVDVTGAISGATYSGGNQEITSFQVFPGAVLDQDITTRLIRQGESTVLGMRVADDLLMRMHFHQTINPNGDATATFDKPMIDCS